MPFSQPMGSQIKTNCIGRTSFFPHTLHRLQVFASNSDWFIALFTSVVIGQSNIIL